MGFLWLIQLMMQNMDEINGYDEIWWAYSGDLGQKGQMTKRWWKMICYIAGVGFGLPCMHVIVSDGSYMYIFFLFFG